MGFGGGGAGAIKAALEELKHESAKMHETFRREAKDLQTKSHELHTYWQEMYQKNNATALASLKTKEAEIDDMTNRQIKESSSIENNSDKIDARLEDKQSQKSNSHLKLHKKLFKSSLVQ